MKSVFQFICYNENGGSMTVLMYIGVYFFRFIYFFMKKLKTKNKIVFISKQSDKTPLDFQMLKNEIMKRDKNIELVFINKRIEKKVFTSIINLKTYFKEMYHLATSKVCVTDGYNITISTLSHKKDLKIIQIWHSLGAIKKFGCQSLNTKKQQIIAKIMCMHKNYDYIISCSNVMIKYYSEAFNCDKNKFVTIGLPRMDYILTNKNKNIKKFYKKYKNLKSKKIILYVPTFRPNDNYKINELIDTIDLKKYTLIVKKHPNMKCKISRIDDIYTCDDFSAVDLLPIADYVITDYSAISLEAAILEKKVYLYLYDYNDYKKNPGINLNLQKEFKYTFNDVNDLYNSILNDKYDLESIKKIKHKYLPNCDGNVTKKLADFILDKVK